MGEKNGDSIVKFKGQTDEQKSVVWTMERKAKEAEAVVKGKFYPALKTVEQVMSAFGFAEAHCIHPYMALDMFHFMPNGTRMMKSEIMLSEFQKAGGKIQWMESTDEVARCKFKHDSCGEFEYAYTKAMAQKAGDWKNTYLKYPDAMLRSRCLSNGIRMAFPSCLHNSYTPEEIRTIDVKIVDGVELKKEPEVADQKLLDRFWKKVKDGDLGRFMSSDEEKCAKRNGVLKNELVAIMEAVSNRQKEEIEVEKEELGGTGEDEVEIVDVEVESEPEVE